MDSKSKYRNHRDAALLSAGCFVGIALAFGIATLRDLYQTIQAVGGLDRVLENHTRLAQLNQLPPTAPRPAPKAPSSAPPPGEPGGPAIQSLVYWIRDQSYLVKPAMPCEPGHTPRPLPFLAGNAWNWNYRDAGDRWLFHVDGPPGSIVFVWAGCDEGAPVPPPGDTLRKPTDRNA